MSNVVSLLERKEVWQSAYQHGELLVQLSNHGRFKVTCGKTSTILQFFDSVALLKELSEKFEDVMCSMYKDVQ